MSEVRFGERTSKEADRPVTDLHPDYPLPDPDHPVVKPFWDGCRERKLLVQRDRATGKFHWPPTPGMKPIGTNTARIENVVAATASPISSVPSRAAV